MILYPPGCASPIPSPGSLLLPAAVDADMSEPTLPTLPPEDTNPANVDLNSSALTGHDEATDVDPPLALFVDEEEEDSVIVPSRYEEASGGEERLRAWREISEERAITRRAEETMLAAQRLRRRRTTGIALGVVALTGLSLATLYDAEEASPPAAVSSTPEGLTVVDLDGPALVATATDSEPPAELTAAEPTTAPVVSPADTTPASDFDPQVVPETLNTWTAGATEWLQFDFLGVDPLEIRWLDAEGQQALNPWTCDGYLNRTTRRCYVGRTHQRIDVALAAGAAPGTWTLQACQPGTDACAGIGSIEVSAVLGR